MGTSKLKASSRTVVRLVVRGVCTDYLQTWQAVERGAWSVMHLWVEIVDLDNNVSKPIHEFSEKFIICLLQAGQCGQCHVM